VSSPGPGVTGKRRAPGPLPQRISGRQPSQEALPVDDGLIGFNFLRCFNCQIRPKDGCILLENIAPLA